MERTELYLQAPSPCFVVDEALLIQNLELLSSVQERTGCRILLAQKAFSMFSLYPLIGKYLSGATASGLYEARLGFEEMGKENHVFSPAYRDEEFDEITRLCGHIVFNSFSQWQKYKDRALAAGCECGIRINPECSTQDHAIYDPCSPGSRLGVTAANFRSELLGGISGLHFHTLCEQDADALERTLDAVEEKFGAYLPRMKWLNFGGGHHITRPDYNVEKLISLINRTQQRYGVQVYLEPGEAVALNAGFLVCTVLEIVENGITNAILDTSAACHMPDVLEMPYRPPLLGAGLLEEKPYCYRLGGPTCLAGDIIGDYSFDQPLAPGDRLIFGDMAHYSMVKTNTFNGMALPSIAILDQSGRLRVQKTFGYEDFKGRLS
ncbi:carboxynorspermidine decarboxylase [Faecalispora sporosphaeroides]|uniref:carboxynorspermidine decarboxylase n=1 Tax=Faecalispora sporosphaeroides TaxID=1549 RepID=UPI00037B99D2|nr:carboxynorspermidine decarboxylase [Faecalispora sporosphaeroides]